MTLVGDEPRRGATQQSGLRHHRTDERLDAAARTVDLAMADRQHLYIQGEGLVYTPGMDVAVTELRAHLSRWIDAAREGNDVVITDRGTPVARIVAIDAAPVIDRLTAQGIISRPTRTTRPIAGNRRRPSPKHPVAEIVSEQRR